MWESPWDTLGCAGMCPEMLENAGKCRVMLGHLGTRQEFRLHRQQQQREAVPTSREFSSPEPPQSFYHKTGIRRAGRDRLPGIIQTFIPLTRRHMKGFVFSSLERGRRFPSPFPAPPGADPAFEEGLVPSPSTSRAIRKNSRGGTGRSRQGEGAGAPRSQGWFHFPWEKKSGRELWQKGLSRDVWAPVPAVPQGPIMEIFPLSGKL